MHLSRLRAPRALLATALLLGLSAAQAQTPIDESRPLAADGAVEISNLKGSIRVTGGTAEGLKLSGELGEDAKLVIREQGRGRVEIEVEYPNRSGWGWGGGSGGDTHLVLEMPTGATLEATSVSADIEVRSVSGAELSLESVSGSLVLADSDPRSLQLATVSGSQRIESGARAIESESVSGEVRITASAADELRAETVSGDLQLSLAQPVRELRVETVSGSARIETGLAPGGSLRAETLSGKLEITLPQGTSARLNAESFSGRIRSAVGEVETAEYGPGSSLQTTLGDGDGRVQLETFSGGMEIRLGGR